MSMKLDAVRDVLVSMGFNEDRVEEAIETLAGDDAVTSANEPLLCQKQVCADLKISYTTLWRIDPPHYVVGGRKRYKLGEVIAYMQREPAKGTEGNRT